MTETVSKTATRDEWTELCAGAATVLVAIQFENRPVDDSNAVLVRISPTNPGIDVNDGFQLDLWQRSFGATNLTDDDKVWARAECPETVKLMVAHT